MISPTPAKARLVGFGDSFALAFDADLAAASFGFRRSYWLATSVFWLGKKLALISKNWL
jgi:hypothetical protein